MKKLLVICFIIITNTAFSQVDTVFLNIDTISSNYGPIYRHSNNNKSGYTRTIVNYTNKQLNIPIGAKIIGLAYFKANHDSLVSGSNAYIKTSMLNTNDTMITNNTWTNLMSTSLKVDSSIISNKKFGDTGWIYLKIDSFTYNGKNLNIGSDFQVSNTSTNPLSGEILWKCSNTNMKQYLYGQFRSSPPDNLASANIKPSVQIIYWYDRLDYDIEIKEIKKDTVIHCGGNQDITVKLKNLGRKTVDSLKINWSINGQLQTPKYWTGKLLKNDITNFKVATLQLPKDTIMRIKIWNSPLNGLIDSLTSNDTVYLRYNSTKTYVVGDKSADFKTVQELSWQLNNIGLCKDVIIEFEKGDHEGQLLLDSVPGLYSKMHKIDFRTSPQSSSKARIWFKAATLENSYIVKLRKVSNVSFSNLTFFSRTTGAMSRVIVFEDNVNNVLFENDSIINTYTSYPSANSATIYDGGGTKNNISNITIKNNTILNGGIGIYIYGASKSEPQQGIELIGNKIVNFRKTGIYAFFNTNIKVKNNYVKNLHGIHDPENIIIHSSDSSTISNNEIIWASPNSGFGIWVGHCDGSKNHPVKIINNTVAGINQITGSRGMGMFITNGNNNLIAFNTVNTSINSSGGGSALAIKNLNTDTIDIIGNIIFCQGKYSVCIQEYINYNPVYRSFDYNMFYSKRNLIFSSTNGNYSSIKSLYNGTGTNKNSIDTLLDFVDTMDLHLHPKYRNIWNKCIKNKYVPFDMDGEERMNQKTYFGADEISPLKKDIEIVDLYIADQCGDSIQKIYGVIKNAGITNIDSFSATIKITGNTHWEQTFNINKTIKHNGIDTILINSINTLSGGIYFNTIYLNLPQDQNPKNDTLMRAYNIFPTPYLEVLNKTACLSDSNKIELNASGADSIFWYSNEKLEKLINKGATFKLKMTNSDTFYLQGVSKKGCKSSPKEMTVDFAPYYKPEIKGKQNYCYGDTIVAYLNKKYTTSEWFKLNNYTSSLDTGLYFKNYSLLPNDSFIVITTDSFNCEAQDTFTPFVENKITPPIFQDNFGCSGEKLILASLHKDSLQWYNDSSSNSQIFYGTTLVIDSFNSKDTFYVRKVQGKCFGSFSEIIVDIKNKPIAKSLPEVDGCIDSTIIISNLSAFKTYWYDRNKSLIIQADSFQVKVRNETDTFNYRVHDNNCFSDYKSFNINGFNPPTFIKLVSDTVCQGNDVKLKVNGTNGSCYWYWDSLGNSLIDTGKSITLANQNNSDKVYVNMKNSGCKSTYKSISFKVNEKPDPSFKFDIIGNQVNLLSTMKHGYLHTWWFPEDTIKNTFNPSKSFLINDTFSVVHIIRDTVSNCLDTAIKEILLNTVGISISNNNLLKISPIPIKDYFIVHGLNYSGVFKCRIYDNYGKLVKSMENLKLNESINIKLTKGVYFFMIETNNVLYIEKVLKE